MQSSKKEQAQPLTLSQALTITAGLAGLIGLISGVIIRFSLANSSSNARFLSPLQTFPALSDWTPELPQETVDSQRGETQRELWESEPRSTAEQEGGENLQQENVDISTIDTFANRDEREQPSIDTEEDPYARLRQGPQLGEPSSANEWSGDEWSENEEPVSEWSEDDWSEEEEWSSEAASESLEPTTGYENYFDEAGSEPFIDSGSNRDFSDG